jgi:hypothetical protein
MVPESGAAPPKSDMMECPRERIEIHADARGGCVSKISYRI